MSDIRLEQLVYGSFPFWNRGYDVLARSPGCRPEWAAEVVAACRRFGEAPTGVTPARALFSLRLPSGPRVVVGVEPQGVDDRGRPGALAFHALLVDPRDDRKGEVDPFSLAGAFRSDWSAEATLDAIDWPLGPLGTATDPRAARIARELARGRRVAFESSEPIDRLAREVWHALPPSSRRRASVATWAFGNANRFDLVALPRLAGIELDRSYVDPATFDADPPPRPGRRYPLMNRKKTLAVVGLIGLLLAAWPAFRALDDLWGEDALFAPKGATRLEPSAIEIGSEERTRIIAGLEALADRLEIDGPTDPGQRMARIADRFHYRGERLTPAEVARLATDPDPDRDRALAWHDRIARTFANDRPLPADFLFLPLVAQLDRLAWSFHLAPIPSPAAVPEALRRALSREGPIRPTPLAARYPPLSDYARFLGKLPRLEGE